MNQSNKTKGGGTRGRKPFDDPSKVRSKRVIFSVTEKEWTKLKRVAGDATLSTFVRDIVVRVLKRFK